LVFFFFFFFYNFRIGNLRYYCQSRKYIVDRKLDVT